MTHLPAIASGWGRRHRATPARPAPAVTTGRRAHSARTVPGAPSRPAGQQPAAAAPTAGRRERFPTARPQPTGGRP
ncbi:hypothetical protein GCM10010441_09880 [Kitasatospora paracochleata]|uniref:Uncharacterized protein n=1 Tax=Kitasatospora paracochleata TaxID=58354 RepID=A0ABT1IXK7_9ACTN|nr:hypothetical protein [Kitasatospora paracochleata]MCP2309887.1 hypothetical protein [Kitasatospora paracochleata]